MYTGTELVAGYMMPVVRISIATMLGSVSGNSEEAMLLDQLESVKINPVW
jgi:hypothetical protein